jgi:hypothetical protein
MADEPSLPKLSWDPSTESFSNHRSRKRVRSSPPPASSEPALFSSDDDPSADNYTQDRKKRKYRGPWYQQRLADSETEDATNQGRGKEKRTFERRFDSGIFMGSDGTDMDEVMDAMEDIQFRQSSSSLRQSRPQIQLERLVSPAEELAREHIQRCLEDGNEMIDLSYVYSLCVSAFLIASSSQNLSSLSNATIRPLSTFTRLPAVAEGVFSNLGPNLNVFLSANALSSLPEELFKLEWIQALSLRSNLFEELPPGIGKLSNMTELNVSQNRLRYLPFEILKLFTVSNRLTNIQLHPNPFLEPLLEVRPKPKEKYRIGLRDPLRAQGMRRGAISHAGVEIPAALWHFHRATNTLPDEDQDHPHWTVNYQVRTDVRYLSANGVLVKGPFFPESAELESGLVQKVVPIARANLSISPPEPRGSHLSRAPSLLEVSLSACSQSPQLHQLPSILPEECPPYIPTLLAGVVEKKESGATECTICGRKFIVPRTEWIEWWEIAKQSSTAAMPMASAASPLRQKENERDVLESMVPLMRRGCSWLCVPSSVDSEIATRSSNEMDTEY